MYDREFVRSILLQIKEALDTINYRAKPVNSASFFTDSPEGMEKLDSICMIFMAVGESLKNKYKITGGQLLSKYPEIDWMGVKGFRDIIGHHYFDIDAEQVHWIISRKLKPLSDAIGKMIQEFG